MLSANCPVFTTLQLLYLSPPSRSEHGKSTDSNGRPSSSRASRIGWSATLSHFHLTSTLQSSQSSITDVSQHEVYSGMIRRCCLGHECTRERTGIWLLRLS